MVLEIIYGTRNAAKLASMRGRLSAMIGIKIIGLNELDTDVTDIDETGGTPLANALLKAEHYYRLLKRPVFSVDSGLYFDGVPDGLQPGVNVRRVNGRRLSDSEMIAHYSSLVKEFGEDRGFGKCLTGRYMNGIALVFDKNNIFAHMGEDLARDKVYLSSVPHEKRVEGFPLDGLSIQIETGKYYYDLEDRTRNPDFLKQDEGYRKFFEYALTSSASL